MGESVKHPREYTCSYFTHKLKKSLILSTQYIHTYIGICIMNKIEVNFVSRSSFVFLKKDFLHKNCILHLRLEKSEKLLW